MEKKLAKAVVLYMPASVIGNGGRGAVCAGCRALDPVHNDICHVLAPLEGEVSSAHGVCGMFAPGPRMGEGGHNLTKAIVGYVENGPTRCGNCEYIAVATGLAPGVFHCRKVEGEIESAACCNAWEK
jgi:hypothetical protein